MTASEAEDVVPHAFGAPLPPVEMKIDAGRVKVSVGLVTESEDEDEFCSVSVLQQLRGSAPYIDLHHGSNMVVHLCISSAPVVV